MKASPQFIVVIGTSAGGLSALKKLIPTFSESDSIAYAVVMHHTQPEVSQLLCAQLQSLTKLVVNLATNDASLEAGHVYIAPHNAHLIVKKDRLNLGFGPRENRWRPSVDVLFRSAAIAYRERAIGIVLTGMLDDGSAGLEAIHQCGGVTIVQDVIEAEYPDMPTNALKQATIDHVLLLSEIQAAISDTFRQERPQVQPPEVVQIEAQISEHAVIGRQMVQQLGEQTGYSCPDCGGSLWEVQNGKVTHYRCHIGHAYSEQDLVVKQSESIEATLWVSLRMMEERRALLEKLATKSDNSGLVRSATQYRVHAEEMNVHIKTLREILFMLEKRNDGAEPTTN